MIDIEKYILRIADTTLILSQRLSEWCSKGPSLEEDIALSNISLDLLGQANGLLEYVSKLNGEISADEYAFKRDEREFYNLPYLINPILPNKVMIVGSGAGNDVAAANRFNINRRLCRAR